MRKYLYVFLMFFSHSNLLKASVETLKTANKCSDSSQPRRVMILVPGTLNSIVPGSPQDLINLEGQKYPYFSAAVRNVIENYFCAIHIIPELSYFGAFSDNGQTTYEDSLNWYNELTQNLPDRPEVWFFGHSAGGFYSLYAAHLNEQNKNFGLPIKKIITLSTPYDGVEFIDRLTPRNSFFSSIAEKFLNFAWPMDFRGLWELKRRNVRNFLNHIKISSQIEVHSFGGSQPITLNKNEFMNAFFLSPPLTILQNLINTVSDGIVSLASVFSEVNLNEEYQYYNSTQVVKIQSHPDYNIPLDHIEQVWDYRYLALLGTTNAKYVLDTQLKIYNDILNISGASANTNTSTTLNTHNATLAQ